MSYAEMVLRIVRSLWIWSASAMLVLGWIPLVGLVRLFDRDPLSRATARMFRRLGWALARVNPWRLHITGRERVDPNQAYVIVSNHQSFADIPVLSHVRLDTKWMAKTEIFRVTPLAWMLRMAGDVPVNRADRRKGAMALLQCARYLRQGVSVVCFPEGTRTRTGEVLPFTEGPFQLAIREGVAVLPMVLDGSGDALPRGSWLFQGTRDIWLRVLEAVPSAGFDSATLRDEVRRRIVEALADIRRSNAA